MTTVAIEVDEVTLLAQLQQIDYNTQVKLESLTEQKVSLESKSVELETERLTIPHEREKQAHRLEPFEKEVAQLKSKLAKLKAYLQVAKGTSDEEGADKDVKGTEKHLAIAEKALERVKTETDEANRELDSREKGIHAALQAIDAQLAVTAVDYRNTVDIRKKKHDEIGILLFPLLVNPFLKRIERRKALVDEIDSIQDDCRAECLQKLAGWEPLHDRLREIVLPSSPTYKVLSAQLAYIEALVEHKDKLQAPLDLPASRTMTPGPRSKVELFSVLESEVTDVLSVMHTTEKLQVRMKLLKQLMSEQKLY